MRKRTVLMYVEIGSFVTCLCGWILICSTLATEYWTFSEVASAVLTTGNFYYNLWMACVSDTTGVSDCKYYPSMMDLSVFLHVSRALAVVSVILGFWGSVFALIGMKCTKIGGSELTNSRITFVAALAYLASGFCGMIVYSMWGNKLRSDFVDPYYLEQKYELGAALFVGWGGSSLLIGGSAVMCYFSGRESFPQKFTKQLTVTRPPTYMTSRTRQTYMLPGSSRPKTVIAPSVYQPQEERKYKKIEGGGGSQYSRAIKSPQPPIDSAV